MTAAFLNTHLVTNSLLAQKVSNRASYCHQTDQNQMCNEDPITSTMQFPEQGIIEEKVKKYIGRILWVGISRVSSPC